MMRKLGIIAAVVVVIIAIIGGVTAVIQAWWQKAYPTYTYRYRMTVEVDVDGQIRSGSSVIEVMSREQPLLRSGLVSFRGEAVLVDLGNAKNLLAILAAGPGGSDVEYPQTMVQKHLGLSYRRDDMMLLASRRDEWLLEESEFPTFVTFDDVNDTKSGRELSPSRISEGLNLKVGNPVVKIQMTGDKVTRTLDSRIPKIMHQLREQEKRPLVVSPFGGRYEPRLGQFFVGEWQ